MKLYAESQVAKGPAFTHLGYLAATEERNEITMYGTIACVLAFSLFAIGFIRKLVKKSTTRVLWILLVIVFLIVWILLLLLNLLPGIEHPKEFTQIQMRQIERFCVREHFIPEEINQLKSRNGFDDKLLVDGWFKEMTITKKMDAKNPICVLTSSGPDEKFLTADDLTFSFSPN